MKKYIPYFPLILIVLAAIVYWITKPPAILWIDSGTMIAASSSLGIPNPPGFPFYMMASHLFTLLPFSKVTSLELFTIIFSLALLFIHYKIILLILQNNLYFFKEAKQNITENRLITNLAAAFGTLSLAFSYQYWSQTQNTEAFIFSYFFVTLFAYLMLQIILKLRDLQTKKISFPIYSQFVFRMLLLTAFLFGIAAGANPTVASFVPGVLYVMFLNRKALNLGKMIVLGSVFAITISAVYSYLPIRASQWPFVNWGNPQTLELFIGHLHGAGLNINEPESGSVNGFTGSPMVFFQSVSYFLLNIFIQFTPFLVVFLVAGLYFVFKQNRYLLTFLLSVPIIDVIYSGVYYSGNQESWFILAWIFFAIFIGIGFYFLATNLRLKGNRLLLMFSLCLLPLIVFFIPLNRSDHTYTKDYAYNLYNNLGQNAILIGTGDFFNSLSHYLHEADVFRPDVTPLTANVFYVNQWSRDGLRHATKLSISDKIDQIIQYKKYSEYNEAMNQFIDENIATHPIYVTHLTLRASALAATSGGQLRLDSRFKYLPHGLTLQVVRASDSALPNLDEYNFKFTKPVTDIPIYLERNYRAGFKNILNDYAYAYEYLADWFAENNEDVKAVSFYKKALEISNANSEVLAHLGEFYANRKDFSASYQYLEKAERLDVKNPVVHFNLGLSYANLGMVPNAIQELNSVKQLSGANDPIALEADKIIKQISGFDLNNPELIAKTKGWQQIQDPVNNFSLKIPPEFSVVSPAGSKTTLISDKNPNSLGLNVEVVETRLTEGENINEHIKKSPLTMVGQQLDTQSVNFLGYIAAVQIFGTTTGESSQRFIFIKGDRVWQFKVYPGNSVKLNLFYQMLSSFKPYYP